ncbi:MAG: peptidylprolyl isomerase, partial [Bacteroidales bacterium]
MAVIQKIRSYSGLLIVVIGIGLAAFVLGDFLGHGPMKQQRNDVGEVEGTSIPYQQFEQRVNQQMENWQQQAGQTPEAEQAFQIRQQVWNDMVREILLDEEFEDLGIAVKAEELYELIHGSDPHPILVQSFSDPATGTYDPQQVVEFLRNFDRMEPEVRNQWVMLEDYIKTERREEKYNQLIGKSYGVPDALAAADFNHRNNTADIRFAYKTTDEIDDDEVNVSDGDLSAVYDNHKHRFRQEASREIKMVVQPVLPSEADQENTLNDILELREELQEVENVPAFINATSDRRFDPAYYGEGELSPQIDPEIFDAQEGEVFGPYMEENAYVVSMLVDAQMRPDSMRASHILISYQGSQSANQQTTLTYEDAQQMADSLLGVVRSNPDRFPELGTEMSDDPSAAANQGDLEWFRDGEMVQEFNEAVVEATVGSFFTVETDFGFHVVHVTDKSPLTQKVQVANLVRNIEPGDRTYQEAYGNVSRFVSEIREGADFEEAADEAGLDVRE